MGLPDERYPRPNRWRASAGKSSGPSRRLSAGKHEHAIIWCNFAVRIAYRLYPEEPEPLQQANRTEIPGINRREQFSHREIATEGWQDRATGFKCHAASPLRGREGKRKIRGELRINRCLHEPNALPGIQADDPIEPALTAICRPPLLELRIPFPQSRNGSRRPPGHVIVDRCGRHRPKHLFGVRSEKWLKTQRARLNWASGGAMRREGTSL